MPAIQQEIHQADDVDLVLTVYTDENKVTIQPMTGASVVGRIGVKSGPLTSIEESGTVTDGPAGKIKVTFPSAATASLAPGDYSVQVAVTKDGQQKVVLDELWRVVRALPDVA